MSLTGHAFRARLARGNGGGGRFVQCLPALGNLSTVFMSLNMLCPAATRLPHKPAAAAPAAGALTQAIHNVKRLRDVKRTTLMYIADASPAAACLLLETAARHGARREEREVLRRRWALHRLNRFTQTLKFGTLIYVRCCLLPQRHTFRAKPTCDISRDIARGGGNMESIGAAGPPSSSNSASQCRSTKF